MPLYMEIVCQGKTRAVLRFMKDSWPWHIYEVRLADFSEEEWREIEVEGLGPEYRFVHESASKKNTLIESNCDQYQTAVVERQVMQIRP